MSRISRRSFVAASAVAVGALGLPAVYAAASTRKLVMIAGTPSHGPGEHEFNAGVQLLKKCLASVKNLEIAVNLNGYPKDEAIFNGADAIFIYCDGGGGHPLIQGNRLETINGLMNKGVSLLCAHYAVEVPKDKGGKQFKEWIGGYYEDKFSCNPMWVPEYKEFPDHPIAKGVHSYGIRDEWYFNMRFREEMKGVTPILTAKPSDKVRNGPYVWPAGPYPHIQEAAGRSEHMMWCVERPDGGRGIGFTGGHYHRNWMENNFRKVVLNSLVWAAKLDVPATGVESTVTEEDIKANLDPKGKR